VEERLVDQEPGVQEGRKVGGSGRGLRGTEREKEFVAKAKGFSPGLN
jgi:hypothetical protein